MKKKIVSLFTVVFMLLSVIPFSAAAEEIVYPDEMDGVYLLNPDDPDNTITNLSGNKNNKVKMTVCSIVIKDGKVNAQAYAYESYPDGTYDYCGIAAYGDLQYDEEYDLYSVRFERRSSYIGDRYDEFQFSWSQDDGLVLGKTGYYGYYYYGVGEIYVANNTNLPLKKVPLDAFEGSYIGQLDSENETHAQLESVTMDINDHQVHLEFTEYGVGYTDDYDLLESNSFYYEMKNGRMAYRFERDTYPSNTYMFVNIYLFEDDHSVLVEWRPIESEIKEVLNLKMVRQGGEPSEPQDYNVNIMGYGLSNTSEYMINILGNIQGTFDEGQNVVASADITTQNLTINTFNVTNGASRVLGPTTLEGMTITVTNGAITNVEVRGRVQTNPGNFDRYIVNCHTF